MKELSIEEKAKRYDEVINRMKHYVIDEYGCSRIKVADVFPELKESEDEKWIHKGNIEYRIKPELAYRPFESAQECIEEMRRHEPFGWVKYISNEGDSCWYISGIRYVSAFSFIKLRGSWMNTNILFENYTFLDGSPFGVKVEDKEE